MKIDVRKELEIAEVKYTETAENSASILCPFHPDTSPSLTVNLETGSFKCWASSCNKKGNFTELLAKLTNKTKEETFRALR